MSSRIVWLFCALLLLGGALPLAALPAPIVPAAPDVLSVKGVEMVPLRAVAEIAGATIDDTRKVYTVTLGEHVFVCSVGDVKAFHDGELLTLPQAPFLLDGCCYVPLRSLVKCLAGSIKAGAKEQTLELTLPKIPPFTVPVQKVTGSTAQLAGTAHLYLVAADGVRVQQLSYEVSPGEVENAQVARAASFTADGSSLVYQRGADIMMRHLDSPVETNLTAVFDKDGTVSFLHHLADDGYLYFTQELQGHGLPHLCRMHLDGSGYQSLVTGFFSMFSADGTWFAYTTASNKPEAHLLNVDGSKDRKLGDGFACALSPDASTLYYTQIIGLTDNGNDDPHRSR